jgi:hypothetical protein
MLYNPTASKCEFIVEYLYVQISVVLAFLWTVIEFQVSLCWVKEPHVLYG